MQFKRELLVTPFQQIKVHLKGFRDAKGLVRGDLSGWKLKGVASEAVQERNQRGAALLASDRWVRQGRMPTQSAEAALRDL